MTSMTSSSTKNNRTIQSLLFGRTGDDIAEKLDDLLDNVLRLLTARFQ